jgi:hypothetical protein
MPETARARDGKAIKYLEPVVRHRQEWGREEPSSDANVRQRRHPADSEVPRSKQPARILPFAIRIHASVDPALHLHQFYQVGSRPGVPKRNSTGRSAHIDTEIAVGSLAGAVVTSGWTVIERHTCSGSWLQVVFRKYLQPEPLGTLPKGRKASNFDLESVRTSRASENTTPANSSS